MMRPTIEVETDQPASRRSGWSLSLPQRGYCSRSSSTAWGSSADQGGRGTRPGPRGGVSRAWGRVAAGGRRGVCCREKNTKITPNVLFPPMYLDEYSAREKKGAPRFGGLL